jgi:NAD(P)-dependent dehydrogenase (short-subunit alcohol dehydrogenase family)
MDDFQGTVAVVTGGSTGIGRSTVDALAGRGASVVFCTHDPQTLPAAGDTDAVTGVAADVRSSDDMRNLMARTVDRYGGIDVLVCCAGIQTYGTAEDTPEEEWHAVLDTNLTGMFLAAKFAIPHMRARGGGAIVNVSSVQGLAPGRRVLGYSVSKAGVDALTRSMAVDHAADRIRVNSVAPGPVATPLLAMGSGKPPPSSATDTHPGRIARPEEIADLIVFLASRQASYVTGAIYLVDGGMQVSQGQVLLPSYVSSQVAQSRPTARARKTTHPSNGVRPPASCLARHGCPRCSVVTTSAT